MIHSPTKSPTHNQNINETGLGYVRLGSPAGPFSETSTVPSARRLPWDDVTILEVEMTWSKKGPHFISLNWGLMSMIKIESKIGFDDNDS